MIGIFRFFEKGFGKLLLIFGVVAYLFPQLFLWAKDIAAELLMFSLFLSGLKIDLSEAFHLKSNFSKLLIWAVLYTVLLPAGFYYLTPFLESSTRMGAFLIIATAGAVMSPLIASFYNLNVLWTTTFVVLTGVIVPFSIPLLTKYLFHADVEVSIFYMMTFLAKMVFIPSILAFIVRKYFPTFVEKALPFTGGIGSMNMILFLCVLVSKNQEFMADNLFSLQTLGKLSLMFLVFLGLYLLGYFLPSSQKKEKWTNSLMFGNMNNGLVVILCSQFFSESVLFMTLISIIPWSVAQPIFQAVFNKYYK